MVLTDHRLVLLYILGPDDDSAPFNTCLCSIRVDGHACMKPCGGRSVKTSKEVGASRIVVIA